MARYYVDGFVLPVPKKNVEAYRRMARKAGKIWLEYGALEYRECVAEDVKVGKVTSFPQSVKLKPDETVVFSWIVYKSRAHRDRVNKKVMKDPRIANMMDPKAMPFDAKRMIYGGFKVDRRSLAAYRDGSRRGRRSAVAGISGSRLAAWRASTRRHRGRTRRTCCTKGDRPSRRPSPSPSVISILLTCVLRTGKLRRVTFLTLASQLCAGGTSSSAAKPSPP